MHVFNREAAEIFGAVNCIIPILRHRFQFWAPSVRAWLPYFAMRHFDILIDHSCDELRDFACDREFGLCLRRSRMKLKQREVNVTGRWEILQCR
jgi:hypothetical protein